MSLIMARAKPPIVPRPAGVRINPYPMNSGRPLISNSNEVRFQAESRFYHLDRKRAIEDAQMTDAPRIQSVPIRPSENQMVGSQVKPTVAGVHFQAGVAGSSMPVKPEEGLLMWKHGYIDPKMEMKRAKRIISNRLSAQRSRLKKLEYVSNTEKKARYLEAEIIVLTQKVESERDTKRKLELENVLIRKKLAFLDQRTNHNNDEMENNRVEVVRLRELHKEQQCMMAAAQAEVQQHLVPALAPAPAPTPAPEPPLEEGSGLMDQIWDYKFYLNPDLDFDHYLDPIFNIY